MLSPRAVVFAASLFAIDAGNGAFAQTGDDNAALHHGIIRAVPIGLPCAINKVPHFDLGDEDAMIVSALMPFGDNRTYVVTLSEVSNLIVGRIDDPTYHKPAIFQSIVPVKDNAGNATRMITASRSDARQRIAFLRANFAERPETSEVILVSANRIGDAPAAPADILIYRLHVEPINDGELVYFAPAFSWQVAGAYATATEALEKTFAIKLNPDGSGACTQ